MRPFLVQRARINQRNRGDVSATTLAFFSLAMILVAGAIAVGVGQHRLKLLRQDLALAQSQLAEAESGVAADRELIETLEEELDRRKEENREIHKLRAQYLEMKQLRAEYEALQQKAAQLEAKLAAAPAAAPSPNRSGAGVSSLPRSGAWIGVALQPLQSTVAGKEYAAAGGKGVVVQTLVPGGPATRSGLAAGDIVIGADGVAVASASQLQAIIQRRAPGQPVVLDLVRGDESLTLSVRTGPVPQFR